MLSRIIPAMATIAALATPSLAQDWAAKMFQNTSHDFGTVAHGEHAEFVFAFENLYVEDVHVAAVRASCHCTTPIIQTGSAKTHEKGAILAHFNTDAFVGARGATLTVTFDKPFFAEVQLTVRGFIRSDVVLQPGSADFGTVDQGKGSERTITLSHSGRPDWRITEVRSSNPRLSARTTEESRNASQVNYQIAVRLDAKAPPGYLTEYLTVVDDEGQPTEIRLPVSGFVQDSLSASPSPLFLGVVAPGQKASKQIVVRGREPFRITNTDCKARGFGIAATDASAEKPLHIVPVTFVAPKDAGRVEATIRIETSLGTVTPVRVFGNVHVAEIPENASRK